MALYMDIHTFDGPVALGDVERAHQADLATQAEFGVDYCRYWVDEAGGKVFCLVEAPNPEVAAEVHRKAHGLLADSIHAVTQGA